MHYDLILYGSGAMAAASLFLSFVLILRHWKNWNKPAQQWNIIKIITMAPLFALDSFFGILELEKGETVAHILDMVKECYEAVAIHAFLMLMCDLCGLTAHLRNPDGKKATPLPEGVKGRELHVPFPLGKLFGPGHPHLDVAWLRRLRHWTLQFVLIRPVLSVVDLLMVDLFPPSSAALSTVISVFMTVSMNICVTTAISSLLTFYHAFEEELAPHRPLAKFICIKGVVFFGFWQGLVLKLLGKFGVLHEGLRFSLKEVELAWQDLLVCVEMGLIFTPLCVYAFPPGDYSKKETPTPADIKEKKEQ